MRYLLPVILILAGCMPKEDDQYINEIRAIECARYIAETSNAANLPIPVAGMNRCFTNRGLVPPWEQPR